MLKNKVNNIMNVFLLENAKLDSKKYEEEYNSFLVIEDIGGAKLVYNLTTGEDHSFDDIQIAVFVDITKILTFYEYDSQDYNDTFELGKIDNIKIYKSSYLYNKFNNMEVSHADYLVLDFKEKKIIIDYVNNHLYFDDKFEIKYKNRNIVDVFPKGGNKLYKFLLKRMKYLRMRNLFNEIVVE